MNSLKTFESTIKAFRHKYGNRFNYVKSTWIDSKTEMQMVCSKHGSFMRTPYKHLYYGAGCRKCQYSTVAELGTKRGYRAFVQKAKDMYRDNSYEQFVYVDTHTKGQVLCRHHGAFFVSPHKHMEGHGCPSCGRSRINEKRRNKARSEFIPRAIKVHGDKYDYSNVKYINNSTLVLIKCRVHGVFSQTPGNHLNGRGCPYCGNARPKNTKLLRTVRVKNRDVYVIGREDLAFNWLMKKHPSMSIQTGYEHGLVFYYALNNKMHRYYPDILLGKRHVIEVKSEVSAGLKGPMYYKSPETMFIEIQTKAMAVKAAGYRFSLLIMQLDGVPMKIPKNWEHMSHEAFMSSMA